MKKRFLLDNDGSNIFHNFSENIERDIVEAVQECSDNVTTYLLCSGAGNYYFPTKAGIVDIRAKGLLKAYDQGKDPFGMFLRELRDSGRETFITFRMNDVHNPTDQDGWNTPRIRREHPDCIVDIEAVKNGRAEWMSYCLDYSRREVREYILEIIGELAELYEFDGLQLDWMRFPRHLSGTPDQVWEKRHFITEFTFQAKQILNKAGAKLAARIPTSISGCRYLGMDVWDWTRNGLIDFITLSPFLTTDFWMPISEFRELMAENPVPIYTAFDFGHGAQNHCPESLRGVAASLFDCGSDGIYLFNFPCWQEYIASRPYHWLKGMDSSETACQKPLLFSISHRRHRIGNVDLPAQLPVKIDAGGNVELKLHLPKLSLPAERAIMLIHSKGDVGVEFNGDSVEEFPVSRRRAEIFVEFVEHGFEGRPAKEDCRIFGLDKNMLIARENKITIENSSDREIAIERVNLGIF